jgi:hypothetical protein
MVFAEFSMVLVVLLLLAASALAFEAGRALGLRLLRRTAPDGGISTDTPALSGVFGLLALLMAFSFGMGLNRYEERRALVVQEANALGTFSSRLALFDEAEQAPIHSLLGEYASARLAFGEAANESDSATAADQADAIHARIGVQLYALLASMPPDTRIQPILQPFNEAGDLAAQRRASREARLPEAVLVLLCLFCVAGAAMLGYSRSSDPRAHRPASLVFFALLAIAFATVLDLDRPRGGNILVPQQTMERQAAALIAAAQQPGA